jgi:hypothetical protein
MEAVRVEPDLLLLIFTLNLQVSFLATQPVEAVTDALVG